KSQLTDLLEADESLRVRVLNTKHGLYEIYGAGEAKVRELIDDEKVIVHGNKYVADKKRKGRFIPRLIKQQLDQELQLEGHPIVTLIERFQGVKLEGELLDFVSNCGIDRATEPLLDIRTNHQPHTDNGIVMDLGASFYATTQGSKANDGSDNLRYLWLVTAPEHSALPPMAYGSDVIGYEPDALGPHTFSVIAKDARGVCNLAIGGFYVTTNDPYNPARGFDDSAADHIT